MTTRLSSSKSGVIQWTTTRITSSSAPTRGCDAGRVYGSSDAPTKLVHDFVAAWNTVMNSARAP
jgi:catalase (peroxidase I)